MTEPHKIEEAIGRVTDQSSFIQELLIDALGWPIDEDSQQVEDISYKWSAADLRFDGLNEKTVDGVARQIRLSGNPWGIFILEFKNPDVFTADRGMTGTLRKVLRGLVPSKRRDSSLASFKRENLLFICTHNYQYYRFAYFKAPEDAGKTAPLATFGWLPGDPIRTLCECNLNALDWPDDPLDAAGWIQAWSAAFDVEKVTKRFYEDYAAVFNRVENIIEKQKTLKGDDLRLFTQSLFNRLMFLRFIERKGTDWLSFPGQQDSRYLAALAAAGGIGKKSLYVSRLRPLFFGGLAVEGKQQSDAYGSVPLLNGGLFEESALDKKVTDIPDEAFTPIISGPGGASHIGLFYRYNFTVEESTPLDIEVAVDPEMLGKVFEELVTGRHGSGSYYTPRNVVAFMCREAIKGYLTSRLEAPAGSVAKLVDEHEVHGLTETHNKQISVALESLKAIDPACGSGAYLLGLLHEMIAIKRSLQSERLILDSDFLYDLKLHIINHNLYGVDIDPFAAEIAKLRLWLSLAVEADKPVPLPNLDFKIETGDSLLGANPQEMPDLFREQLRAEADKLAVLKCRHFESHGPEKLDWSSRIRQKEQELAEWARSSAEDVSVDYRVRFAEVYGSSTGFDLVIMNPPYVATYSRQSESEAVLHQQRLKGLYREYGGRLNLFTAFIVRAMQLCDRNGSVAFIVPDSYATSDSYAKVRLAYTKRFTKHLWTLVRQRLFVAAVRNVIVVAGPGEQGLRAVVAAKRSDLDRLTYLHGISEKVPWGTHSRVAFFSVKYEMELWRRMAGLPRQLDTLFETRDGVNPGPRHVRELIVDSGVSTRDDRSLIEGSNISPSGFVLQEPYRTICYDQKKLTERDKKAGASLRSSIVFESPKIVSRQTADTLIAAIDIGENLVALNSVHCTRSIRGSVSELWGLLGLLNSPLARLYYAIDGGETRDLLPQVHISWIRSFPLPEKAEALFVELSDFSQAAFAVMKGGRVPSRELQAIHSAVCGAYGLSESEADQALSCYLARYPRFASAWNADQEFQGTESEVVPPKS